MAPSTGLATYRRKRDFGRTPEPSGKKRPRQGFSYVIQKHAARRLHYDFRLELDGVLLSWAVPKGPSLDPQVKRLAVQTEDHPVEYGGFEGTIPKGEYGGGTVMIWDRGTWEPEGDPRAGYEKGRLSFTLHGERLRGRWHLVRTRGKSGAARSWLLFKGTDELASADGEALVEAATSSVVTRRSLDEIAAGRKSGGALPGAKRAKPPARIEVEKATLVGEAPEGDEWLHELKLDGYRLVAYLRGERVRLLSRSGQDLTERVPKVVAELGRLGADQTVLDGELVALRPDGVSDFQLLQNSLGASSGAPTVYYAFDLPYLEGYDLRGVALEARKRELESLLGRTRRSKVRLSDHVVGQGPAFLEKACAAGAEGIVAKRRDSLYRGTRTREWLKIKCLERQEMVIGGFTEPAGSRPHLGALLVGFWEDGSLRYAGKVGTGFTQRSLREIRAKLTPLERREAPFADPPRGAEARGVHWVEPRSVAEVEFTELTGDKKLRHPTFRGLREDKPAREVGLERPQAVAAKSRRGGDATERGSVSKAKRRAGKRAIGPRSKGEAGSSEAARLLENFRLTHPDRVLYPEAEITKRDLALYDATVAPFLLPHVAERPLTLVRCPQGRSKQCFFQKHAQKGQPEAVRIVPIEDEGGLADYTYIRDVEGLLALAQMGVLEIHTWGSHVRDPERPDILVMDLDPDETVPWKQVVEGAELLRGLFEQLDLEPFVKTTGGKGLHVCVPFQSRLGWDEVKGFCQAIAEAMVAHAPERYVATMSKAKRKGRIFVDYLRNGRGATFIAPYSTRARPGAPVAMPVGWDEIAKLRPGAFTLRNVPAHLERRAGDPWAGMAKVKQRLTLSRLRSVGPAATARKTRAAGAAGRSVRAPERRSSSGSTRRRR